MVAGAQAGCAPPSLGLTTALQMWRLPDQLQLCLKGAAADSGTCTQQATGNMGLRSSGAGSSQTAGPPQGQG